MDVFNKINLTHEEKLEFYELRIELVKCDSEKTELEASKLKRYNFLWNKLVGLEEKIALMEELRQARWN